jgi:hypothetical protein
MERSADCMLELSIPMSYRSQSDKVRRAERAAGGAFGADGAADAGSVWVLKADSTAGGTLGADSAADSVFDSL